MRKIFGMAVVCISLLLAACAIFTGRQVNIPLYQLQETVSHRFPTDNHYLDLFDIYISNPHLTLQPETDRITVIFDARIAPPFMPKPWEGTLAISGGLRFDPARNAIMLANPRIEKFDFNGLEGFDPSYEQDAEKIGNFLAAEILKDVPLYTFDPAQLRYHDKDYFPSHIVTSAAGLVVTFERVK